MDLGKINIVEEPLKGFGFKPAPPVDADDDEPTPPSPKPPQKLDMAED